MVDERSVGWLRVRKKEKYLTIVRFLSALKAPLEWLMSEEEEVPEFVPAAERYLDGRAQHVPIEAPALLGVSAPRPTFRTGLVTSYTGARGQGGRAHHAHLLKRLVVWRLHALDDEELGAQLELFQARDPGENPLQIDLRPPRPEMPICDQWRGTPLIFDHIANDIATAVGYGLCTDELRASDHHWDQDKQEKLLRCECARFLRNVKLGIVGRTQRKGLLERLAMQIIKRGLRTYGLQPDDLFKGNAPPEDAEYIALFASACPAH